MSEALAEIQARLQIPGGGSLRPYQQEGALWLAGRDRALLADTMGLGKSIQALAAVPERAPVLILCPAVAKGVWERHVPWRRDLIPQIPKGRVNWRFPHPGEVLVSSYAGLPSWLDTGKREWFEHPELGWLQPPEGLGVILDEAHYTKNKKAIRSKRAKRLCQAARDLDGISWGLTGTPLKRHPDDLWELLGVLGLQQETWKTYKRFARAFGRDPDTYEWTGRVEAGVPRTLQRIMLRREFEQVIPDMPPRDWEDIPIPIDRATAKACDAAAKALKTAGVDLETATREALLTALTGAAGGELMRARKMLAAAKTPALLELLDGHELSRPGDPALVWSAHLAPVQAAAQRSGWALLTGSMGWEARRDLENAFQRGELRGVALTIRAGGTAITLTRANWAVFVDLDWTPADNEQAEARNYRLGQTRPVRYTTLVADHAIDRRLLELLQSRRELAAASVGAATVQGALSANVHSDLELLAKPNRQRDLFGEAERGVLAVRSTASPPTGSSE